MSSLNRREFLYMMSVLGASSLYAKSHKRLFDVKNLDDYYKIQNFGNARFMHITDVHAQLLPIHFREPSVNLGFYSNYGKPPHIVGTHFLKHFGIKSNSRAAFAMTCVNYVENAKRFHRVGGFAHLKTLTDHLRTSFGKDKTLLLDGGDTWQGSATALYTRGKDMVDASNILGVDIMTGHWEFTYKEKEILDNIKASNSDFVAQNVFVKDESLMNGVEAYNEDTGRAFKPYVMKKIGDHNVAIIGQAFPYTAIANPQRFIPDWTFGIRPEEMQTLIDKVKSKEKPDAIILLSHNGFDVDKKMASVVNGIDFIMGGHTHDAVPQAIPVKNSKGITHVVNSGSNAKFLGVLDLDIKDKKVRDFRFTLMPVFSDLLPENKEMKAFIDKTRAPFLEKLTRPLATTDDLLYRRGNFNGTFDQIICDALREVKGADISLSPGFRWGTTVMPGGTITFDDLMNHTAMTYPETYIRDVKGADLHNILEDVADNLFNKDPFLQQGGDMVRTGGLSYTIDPRKNMGKRITNLELSTGEKIDANRIYKMAGWSTVGSASTGEPVWETVEKYLSEHKHIKNLKLETPDIIGVKNNPGIELSLYKS
ncbi:MAG: thiosulfohydrolase SoxB [Epsilonproteobacteria bacterium]|nr:thiosulfohydrolase SoxB [Campylobacterota bacterium]